MTCKRKNSSLETSPTHMKKRSFVHEYVPPIDFSPTMPALVAQETVGSRWGPQRQTVDWWRSMAVMTVRLPLPHAMSASRAQLAEHKVDLRRVPLLFTAVVWTDVFGNVKMDWSMTGPMVLIGMLFDGKTKEMMHRRLLQSQVRCQRSRACWYATGTSAAPPDTDSYFEGLGLPTGGTGCVLNRDMKHSVLIIPTDAIRGAAFNGRFCSVDAAQMMPANTLRPNNTRKNIIASVLYTLGPNGMRVAFDNRLMCTNMPLFEPAPFT